MMSYPLEKDKGRSFAIFWSLFQLGTLVGAAIALGIEAKSNLPCRLDKRLRYLYGHYAHSYLYLAGCSFLLVRSQYFIDIGGRC